MNTGRQAIRVAKQERADVVLMDIRMPELDGLAATEIADHLTLSPLTVKTHANHAMTKLGARDRAQLVVLAYQVGLAGRR